MKATRFLLIALLLAAATSVPAMAGPKVVLSVDVKEEITYRDADGTVRVTRRDVERAEPGDVLVYTLNYTNTGTNPAENAKVEDPIPAGTILLPASVQGDQAKVTFSVDGGKTYTSYPAKVVVRGEEGKVIERVVSPERYTHIRWTAIGPLAPGETRTASFKVIVR